MYEDDRTVCYRTTFIIVDLAKEECTLADARHMRTRRLRVDRRDAALVAEYIHQLSERHGSGAAQAARRAGVGTGNGASAGASRSAAAARAASRARTSSA